MSTSVMTRLVMKDVYLNRLLIGAAMAFGVPSVLITPINKVMFGVGGMFYLTTIIAYGVMLVMYSVVQERKDKALLFAMSLPISYAQYLKSKLLAAFLTFVVPWATLTLTALGVILATRIQDGMASYLIMDAFFMLMNFCVILGIGLRTRSEVAVGATVILTNLSVSLFFMGVANNHDINAITNGDTVVFNRTMLWIIAVELILTPVALTIPFWFRRGKGDVL
jgi:ABC-2 type transport system permease protein